MKANRLRWFLVFLLGNAVFQLPAQQSEADRKLLADIRAKADKGDAVAQFYLGFCYYKGQRVAKDEAEAVKWYRKAAEQNDAEAQNNLGDCYANGQGVEKDYVEGYKWSLLAVGQGVEGASESLTTLEARMTPEQIAEG